MLRSHHLYLILAIYFAKCTIVVSQVPNVCSTTINEEILFYDCNSPNYFQNKLTGFIDGVIEKHLYECFVIHLRKQDNLQPQSIPNISRILPLIDVNMWDAKLNATNLLHFHRKNSIIRFQKQCIVYYITLYSVPIFSAELASIATVFTEPLLQVQAHHSYIIVNEFENPEIAENFLFLPQLSNYKYRTWVELNVFPKNSTENTTQSEIEPEEQYEFNHFCYYCNGGNPSVFSQGILYFSLNEVTHIDNVFPDVTQNLHGHVLRVTAPVAPPLVHIVPSPKDPKKNIIEGMQAEILNGISRNLNFTCHVQHSVGGTGVKLPNGTWIGIMGDIMYDNVDIGISVAVTYDRYKTIDFSVSVIYAFLILASTKPTPFFEWEAIFYPFSASAWLAVSLATFASFFIFKFFHNHAAELEVPSKEGTNKESALAIQNAIKKEQVTNFEAFYLTVGSLLEQGVPFSFDTIPSRMFSIFLMFFAIIVTCAYRSKLFAFLTFPTVEVPPNNFKELDASGYTWGMKSLGGVALLFVKKSPISYVRELGERMEIYDDRYSCLDKTFQLKPRFTCMVYKGYLEFMIEVRYWKLRQKFHTSEIVSPPIGAAWSMKKYAPILPKLDIRKTIMFEMGLSEKFLVDYRGKMGKGIRTLSRRANFTGSLFDLNTNFKNDDGDGTKPLEIVNLYGGFFILFFGCAISSFILLSEKIQFAKNNKISQIKDLLLYSRFRSRLNLQNRQYGNATSREPGQLERLRFPEIVRLLLPHPDQK